MAALKITVNCRSMLISTAFFRFSKGVEHCYYALLFTSEPYLSMGAKPWLSWLEIGFHLAAREAPSAAGADRMLIDARPGRNFEITASAASANPLVRLRELVTELDRVRRSLGSAGAKDRLAAIASDRQVKAMLLTPLEKALTANSIPADGRQAYAAMIDRGLLAICEPQITSIEMASS